MSHQLSELAAARAELDDIDDALLALLERRFAVAGQVARAKRGSGVLTLHPHRQAEVVARLQSAATNVPAPAVASIWREVMSATLHHQAPTTFVLVGCAHAEPAVRAAYGSAALVETATDVVQALTRAAREEVVLILPTPAPSLPPGLHVFQQLDDAGVVAVGRIAADEVPAGPAAPADDWTPASWRGRPAVQMPLYPDAAALQAAERALHEAGPLTTLDRIRALRRALAEVANGEGLLLQGGDCAESFDAFGAVRIRDDRAALLAVGATLPGPVVHIARMAGQFAKPRSTHAETHGDRILPTYRGDAVNGAAFDGAARTPDPCRLLRAHAQSRATCRLLDAYHEADALHAPTPRVWTSHEALLLPYEEALTVRDPDTGRWWAGSGDMVWIGHRTQALDGAHVHFASGIKNPVGLKCGPGMSPDVLLRLVDQLDPGNEPGRLVLIARFGFDRVERELPALMGATRDEGRRVIWACDPMHGNTIASPGRKTRRMGAILGETRAFLDIAEAEGVRPGGLHLEMTGADVTECVGGAVAEEALGDRYESLCDPRLNPGQALAVAALVREWLEAAGQPAARVA